MDIVLELVPFKTMVFESKKYFRNGARRSRGSGGGSPWESRGVWGPLGHPKSNRIFFFESSEQKIERGTKIFFPELSQRG